MQELRRRLELLRQPWAYPLRTRLLLAACFARSRRFALEDLVTNIFQSDAVRARELAPAIRFADRYKVLRHALQRTQQITGMVLEFGVYRGDTLRYLASHVSADTSVVGFDSFAGLKTNWGDLLPAGHFRCAVPQFTQPNVRLEVGMFEDTLPSFVALQPEPIRVLHIDCDLYDSTRYVLEQLIDRMAPGGVVVFDEYYGYPSFEGHEYRAWKESCAARQIAATPIACSSHSCAFELPAPG